MYACVLGASDHSAIRAVRAATRAGATNPLVRERGWCPRPRSLRRGQRRSDLGGARDGGLRGVAGRLILRHDQRRRVRSGRRRPIRVRRGHPHPQSRAHIVRRHNICLRGRTADRRAIGAVARPTRAGTAKPLKGERGRTPGPRPLCRGQGRANRRIARDHGLTRVRRRRLRSCRADTRATTANDNTIAVVTPIANMPRPVRRSVDTSSFDIRRPRIRTPLHSLIGHLVRSPKGARLGQKARAGSIALRSPTRKRLHLSCHVLRGHHRSLTKPAECEDPLELRQVCDSRHILVCG